MAKQKKRKRKARNLGSNLVRLSNAVYTHIRQRRSGKEPIDATLRRLCGLPTRGGILQPLKEVFVIEAEGGQPLCFTDEAHARGVSIQRAVQKELKWNKAERVICYREVPSA